AGPATGLATTPTTRARAAPIAGWARRPRAGASPHPPPLGSAGRTVTRAHRPITDRAALLVADSSTPTRPRVPGRTDDDGAECARIRISLPCAGPGNLGLARQSLERAERVLSPG